MARVFLPVEQFVKPVCPNGHFKPEVGVDGQSKTCWVCKKEKSNDRKRLRDMARRAASGKPATPVFHDATNFHEVREYLGLNRKAFARVLGVAESTTYEWEAGRKRISEETLQRILPRVAVLLSFRKEQIKEEHRRRAEKRRFNNQGAVSEPRSKETAA